MTSDCPTPGEARRPEDNLVLTGGVCLAASPCPETAVYEVQILGRWYPECAGHTAVARSLGAPYVTGCRNVLPPDRRRNREAR
jgi:hypothetical protein